MKQYVCLIDVQNMGFTVYVRGPFSSYEEAREYCEERHDKKGDGWSVLQLVGPSEDL